MFRYFLKRIVLFIPTLLVISLIVFGLSQINQADVISYFCNTEEGISYKDAKGKEDACRQVAANLGLDKAPFYFAIRSKAFPDTLHQIYDIDKKAALSQLINQYGNWDYITNYHKKTEALANALYDIPDSLVVSSNIKEIRSAIGYLYVHHKHDIIRSQFERIQKNIQQFPAIEPYIGSKAHDLYTAYSEVRNRPSKGDLYVPTFRWYGLNNQYHHWISNFFSGDFGKSFYTKEAVSTSIWGAAKWTVLINLLSIFFVYLLSIPLGVKAATKKGTWFDKISSTLLFLLYSVPTFWLATLLVVFITTPEFGMDWFPTGGLGDLDDSAPFWNRFWDTTLHLVLPVFCVSYGSFAYISRQVRGSLLTELNQDYVRTARAKGLKDQSVIWKHGFRNSLFPLITLLASILPATIAGSVIIEIIFSIPGMGRLAYNAILQGDWPIVYAVIMLTAILTLVGNLIADMLYALADPRVSFTQKST